MRRSLPPPALRHAAAAGLAMLAAAGAAAASPFDPDDAGWEGLGELRDAARADLGAERVAIVTEVDWGALREGDGLLVVHPEHPLDADELAAFVEAGGRVALLDDFGAGARTLARWKVERVPAPAHPAETLRGRAALPIAEPRGDVGPRGATAVHPTLVETPRLMTNHPTGLRQPKMATVLALRDEDGSEVPLALAGVLGRGRLLAMGDPSAVMNEMWGYAGNRAFGRHLARWLVEDEAAGRTGGKLVVASGRIEETGSFSGRPPLAREAARRLGGAAEALREAASHGLPAPLAFALALAVTLAAVVRTWQSAGKRYVPRPPAFVDPAAATRASAPEDHR